MRRWALLATVVLTAVAGCGDEGEEGYTDDIEVAFLATCIENLGGGESELCECTYSRLVDEVPFERFREIDRQITDDPSAELPGEVVDLVVKCAAETGVGTTTTDAP